MERRALRKAYGAFATGVTVVTVGGAAPHGMTANSFTSVSLDPPLVLVCVDRTAQMHGRIDTEPVFGVSVLAAEHDKLARHFADPDRPEGAPQFDGVDWEPGPRTGVPLISRALAWFECEVARRYDGGDHTIVLGRLLTAERCGDGGGLLFQYGNLWPDESARGSR
ncbi:flavin reductase family protein [Actinoplanes sp. LDG1-06]|uniref:Flavin reductase family protein n=1 Tax=Paractinoplanes ovalisporus TaxID=2810368 RepID=A0ABS2AJU2_9ACTN|nr:flavin reductase family protein [Actinoplanes ovalisporus]MBM2620112.1 flavin reductase family protein [Actinoplanes ovalisporus]